MLDKLWKDGIAISVDVKLWGGDVALEPEDVGLDRVNVPSELFQMGRKRLVPKESLANLTSYRMQTRNTLFKYGFPMPFGDVWFVPWTLVPEVTKWLKETQNQFYAEVEKFLVSYNSLRETFLNEHGQYKAVLEPCYPLQNRLTNRFWYKYSLFELSVPNSPVLSEEDTQRVEAEIDTFLKQVTVQLRKQAGEAAEKLATTLQKDSTTKASLGAMQNMIQRFKSLNFVKDGKMENALDLLNAALAVGLDNPNLPDVVKVVVTEAKTNGDMIEKVVNEYKRFLDLD